MARGLGLVFLTAAALITEPTSGPIRAQTPPFADRALIPLFQARDPRLVSFETCEKRTVGAGVVLALVHASPEPARACATRSAYLPPGGIYGVFLIDQASPANAWALEVFPDVRSKGVLRLETADRTSAVLAQLGDYATLEKRIKLFYDLPTRQLIGRREYAADIGEMRVQASDDRLCATVRLERDRTASACLAGDEWQFRTPDASGALPREIRPGGPDGLPPLPQSTYADFARARPERVADNYRLGSTRIEEEVGPWQRVGNRIWFGRTFYDGEGTTGVGAIGFFDLESRSFSFLPIVELSAWSVSSLLIEDGAAWVALVSNREGARLSNGVLHVDLRTARATRRLAIPHVVRDIVRWRGTLWLGTDGGLYAIGGETVRQYTSEPSIGGGFEIVARTMPATPAAR